MLLGLDLNLDGQILRMMTYQCATVPSQGYELSM